MKKKVLKTAAFFTALCLITGLAIFANALVGNPVSRLLAKRTAEAYLQENYRNTDFMLERISYSFKEGGYFAYIQAPGSTDRYFTLSMDMAGNLVMDRYESMVLSGENTARRLNQAYRDLADSVLESPSFPFTIDIAFGDLAFGDILQAADLEPDRIYDVRELGAEAGQLTIYIDDETVRVDRAAEILLELKRMLEQGGVPFSTIDFVLQRPQPGDGPRPEIRVEVIQFPCAEIYASGLAERIAEANNAAREYHAVLDQEK